MNQSTTSTSTPTITNTAIRAPPMSDLLRRREAPQELEDLGHRRSRTRRRRLGRTGDERPQFVAVEPQAVAPRAAVEPQRRGAGQRLDLPERAAAARTPSAASGDAFDRA